ncbi:MAG: hypothetical protein ACI82Z_000680 [Cellvibrionaceae bacterium]|jgi:hypothetical protein
MDRGIVRPNSGLNLREKPNGLKMGLLAAGEEIEILEEVKFLRVKTSNGTTGYVHGDYIEELPSGSEAQLTSATQSEFPSPSFELVKYRGENFIGRDAMVDSDFVNSLNRINKYAGEYNVKVWVTSSSRNINQQVKGAIVPPASRSCHHVGHAIDMNVQFAGTLYNSKKLRKSNFKNLPESISGFIQSMRKDIELRWGGDFNTEDPVHIDDDLFHRYKTIYLSKLQSRIAQLNT